MEKSTYTKSIMSILLFLYFMGAVLGTILLAMSVGVDLKYGRQINIIIFVIQAIYLAVPTTAAIGFYTWKSKAENLLKIRESNKYCRENPYISDNISKIGGNK